jgi:hypothetical protein
MRTALALVALLVITVPGTAINSGKPKNGYWWDEMNLSNKISFVEGYITGVSRANFLVNQAITAKKINLPSGFNDTPVIDYLDFTEITYGQFMQGLDTFYGDYRNKRINVNISLLYIRDEIRGSPKSELETRIEGMRQATTNPGYDDLF